MKRFLQRFLHNAIEFIRRLVQAVRHVISGGDSTRSVATRRARRPSGRCSACHQPIEHSQDWRDHLEEQHPNWTT